jgi:hypothetical protein
MKNIEKRRRRRRNPECIRQLSEAPGSALPFQICSRRLGVTVQHSRISTKHGFWRPDVPQSKATRQVRALMACQVSYDFIVKIQTSQTSSKNMVEHGTFSTETL